VTKYQLFAEISMNDWYENGVIKMFEDNDIKIAGKTISQLPDDLFSEEIEIKRQGAYGNIDKARSLGSELADVVIDYECDFTDLEIEDNYIKLHTKILFAFIVFTSLENYQNNKILASTTLSTFDDKFKKRDAILYDELSRTGAFSFYYLCVRRGNDIERCIGRTFAMLCGKDGDATLIEYGEVLYFRFLNIVKMRVKDINFV
jgi:hypothetical protein